MKMRLMIPLDSLAEEFIEEFILRRFAIEAEPVKHGRWVWGVVEPGYFTPGGNRPWICSECGHLESWMLDKPRTNYCPNCGAKMDGGNEDG